jgi:hypothetical protein
MADLILGPAIITKYCPATNRRDSRILATHKRDSETTWRRCHNYDQSISSEDNHLVAAEKLLSCWPYQQKLRIVARGHDEKGYYFVCSSL